MLLTTITCCPLISNFLSSPIVISLWLCNPDQWNMMQMCKYLNYELSLLLQCCSEQFYPTEGGVVVVVILWYMDWPLSVHSVSITANSNPFMARSTQYNVRWYNLSGRWFSPGTPVSSTNKTDRHDIAEILLKVVLNTINQPTQLIGQPTKIAIMTMVRY